jgi:thymidylate synthase (FAD)
VKISVLDHGYVELIEAYGTGRDGKPQDDAGVDDPDYECGIVEAARQSTQGAFRGWGQDAKLLKYLYDHKHATPFEFAGMIIEVRAPIFVLREWHRHRTQSYNEMSARYSPLPDLYYVPTYERVMMSVGKQGGVATDAVTLTETCAERWRDDLGHYYQVAEMGYQLALRNGIPKELARLVMPVGHYTQMRASANLRNWLGFLTLRLDPAAQWEIRQYAGAVGQLIAATFPKTWELFCPPNTQEGKQCDV